MVVIGEKGVLMKNNPTMMIVVLVFAAIMGVALLARTNALTGGASGIPVATNSGTVLSVVAALLAIGVLIVAGLQQQRHR